jgi:hypothetical protein
VKDVFLATNAECARKRLTNPAATDENPARRNPEDEDIMGDAAGLNEFTARSDE